MPLEMRPQADTPRMLMKPTDPRSSLEASHLAGSLKKKKEEEERKRENVWKEGLVHGQSLAEKEKGYRWGVGKGGDSSEVQSR